MTYARIRAQMRPRRRRGPGWKFYTYHAVLAAVLLVAIWYQIERIGWQRVLTLLSGHV